MAALSRWDSIERKTIPTERLRICARSGINSRDKTKTTTKESRREGDENRKTKEHVFWVSSHIEKEIMKRYVWRKWNWRKLNYRWGKERNFYLSFWDIVRGPKVEEISRSHQDKDKGKREGVELQKHPVLQFIGSLGQWKYGLWQQLDISYWKFQMSKGWI